MHRHRVTTALLVAAAVAAGCSSGSTPAAQTTSTAERVTTTTAPAPDPEPELILEMQRLTGGSPFTRDRVRLGVREQFDAIAVPTGWVKGAGMQLVPAAAELQSVSALGKLPPTQEFVSEIPGPEFKLLARVGGTIIGVTADGATRCRRLNAPRSSRTRRARCSTRSSTTRTASTTCSSPSRSSCSTPVSTSRTRRPSPAHNSRRAGPTRAADSTRLSWSNPVGLAYVFSQVERSLWQRYEP